MAIDTIKFKRGNKNKLDKLSYGEPAYISDEGELYIGTESGVEKLTRNKEVEELSSQLTHIENYKNNLLNIFEYNKCDDNNCSGNCGKVKGDGIHDDTLGLQNAINYCWDNNIGGVYLPIPIEHYTTTSPLHLWGSSSESVRKKVALVGDGKELTKIVKTTNTCSNLKNHTNIDAVLILANDYIKNNNSLKEEIDTSGLGICHYNEVSGISLSCVSRTNRVKYGVYSVGWFYARFTDVQFENVDTGMNTLTWNCYSTYDRLRFNRTLNGCDFGTSQIGGQTTMLFQDCHANGLDGCVFNIRGNATFINCAIDGGGGTHYKAQANYRSNIGWGSAKIVLINCHHESPSVFANNHLFDLTHAEAYVYTSSMEIPTYNFTSASSVIKLTKGSTFVLHDTNIDFRFSVESCPGMLVDKDVSSRFILNNSFIDTEMFDVYKHCVYNQGDCIVLSNRVINTPIVKGVSYIPSNVPTQNIPKPLVERTDTRLVFSSSNNVDSAVYTATYIFTKKVDLTNMAKINVLGDIDLGDVSGTSSGNFKIALFEELPQDDFCYRGTPLSSYLSSNTHDYNDYNVSTTNYSKQNANRFIDITDVIGEYYIGISINSRNGTASIKEVKIIR
ncbi:MAG: hypothetical protein J6D47_03730 [Peptostreptococcaceae bacterium]|nr:hypothetical protein [Peptostreptococcaceae bacterium]